MIDLAKKKCVPCEGGTMPYSQAQAREMLTSLKGWNIENNTLAKLYPFTDS